MLNAPATVSSQEFPLWREAHDLYARSRFAGHYHLLTWALLWFTSPYPDQNLGVWLGGSLLLAALFGVRWLNRPAAGHSPERLQRWLSQQWLIILVHALIWGLMLAGLLLHPRIDTSPMLVMLAAVVFGTATAVTYPMRPLRCALAILCIYLPSTLVMSLFNNSRVGESLALLVYLTYLGLFLHRWHREYQVGLDRELRLIQHREQLQTLSCTDSLTQLGNRYQFNSLFAQMVANAQRQDEPLSMILLDIDFFKRINDDHGHSVGDACLGAFAECLRQGFRRDSDALLRLGGEEFAVLMPNTPLEQAQCLAEQFRQRLEQQGFNHQGQVLALTASLGVGCFDEARDGNREAFFKRVDDALYRAKSEGRNRVVLA